jgi:hypothetical protein
MHPGVKILNASWRLMDLQGPLRLPSHNLNCKGHSNGIMSNRTMSSNSRIMTGDCVRVILRGLRELFRFLFLFPAHSEGHKVD